MVYVVMDQRGLGRAKGALDCMQLLHHIHAFTAVRDHADHVLQVTAGAFEALEHSGMGLVEMRGGHARIITSPGGYRQDQRPR